MKRFLLVTALLGAIVSGFAYAEPLNFLKLGMVSVDGTDYQEHEAIVVAVVDDAFDVNAEYLNGMLWRNRREVQANGVDDDNNGRIDDVHGWDVSDLNEALAPPKSRQAEFDHGIYIAGLVAEVVRQKLGERDDYPIKLMLVKAVSDYATELNLKDGYRGIDYAVEQQADIIVTAWSGGRYSRSAKQSLNSARNAGAFVVNAVGNYPTEQPSFPASHPAVFGVGGVDVSGKRSIKSNYGVEVDLVAHADNIDGKQWVSDTLKMQSGTSVATALVAATAALMKLTRPSIGTNQLSQCLKASASAVDQFNPLIPAKLGAGLLQIDGAIKCAKQPMEYFGEQRGLIKQPEGSIGISRYGEFSWTISPNGPVEHINLSVPNYIRDDIDAEITVYGDGEDAVYDGAVKAMPEPLVVPGRAARIQLTIARHSSKLGWHANFNSTPIDREARFCHGRVALTELELAAGEIGDGSSAQQYAANSDCQWFISHREGEAVRVDFSRLNLSEGDSVYLFNSDDTQRSNLLATLKGRNLPPSILVKGGPLLIWFLSNSEHHGDGFSFKISRDVL